MRRICRNIFVAASLLFLAACQTSQPIMGNNLFQTKSDDTTVTAAVNEAFMKNKSLARLPIQVQTMNGTVALSGYVRTIRQSDTAQDVAGKVPGVKMVQNNLIVRK